MSSVLGEREERGPAEPAGVSHPHPYGAAPAWAGAYAPVPRPPSRFSAFLGRWAARSPSWLAPASILACFAGASAYVLSGDLAPADPDAAPTCLVKLTTGFDCPGCGGTRAFRYLLVGNVPAAARHHIVFVFAVPFLIYAYAAWAGKRVFRWRLPKLRVPPLAIGLFLGAWLAFTIARNLPWEPFSWMYV
jgi:hypothetical protein